MSVRPRRAAGEWGVILATRVLSPVFMYDGDMIG